jgi:osmotically-inducible protein OsmY
MSERESEILERARERLRSEPRLGPTYHPGRLEMTEDGALLIEGEVDRVAAKKRAMVALAGLPEVRSIVDRLHVRPAAEMGDAEIRAHLRESFAGEPTFREFALREVVREEFEPYRLFHEPVAGPRPPQGGRIEIEVFDGVVTLSGSVPGLTARRLAGVLAWWVPGARDVVNGIAVEPEEEDGPTRLEEGVRTALEKDPYIDASQVRVGVRERVVHLTGLLPSPEQREMAERDAWYVLGVNDVIDDIEVRP